MELMAMNTGRQISTLRKQQGLTQNQLGEKLHVSFQAVSKWERGETLPDVSLLPDLARALGTSIDQILTGGSEMEKKKPEEYTRTITMDQMREGLACFERIGELLGKGGYFYKGAVGGVNLKMNTDFEKYMADPYTRECFVAEAAIQALMDGAYISPDEIRTGLQYPHWREVMLEYAKKYGIE